MIADDLINGMESSVNGTVSHGNAAEGFAVLHQLHLGGGPDGVAGIDHIGIQGVGGRHLHGGGSHNGVQLAAADVFLLGCNALESLVYSRLVFGGKVVT